MNSIIINLPTTRSLYYQYRYEAFVAYIPLKFVSGSILTVIIVFLVACTRLYKSLCWSVGPSVCLSVTLFVRHTVGFSMFY